MAAREGKKALKEAHDAWLHGWIMEMENTGKLAEGDEGSRSGQIEKIGSVQELCMALGRARLRNKTAYNLE
jgi:hypothetical protein